MSGSDIRLVFIFPPKDSTKNAYTCEITFLALVPWVQPWKYKCNESSWNSKLTFNSGFVYIWKIPLKPALIPSTSSRSAFEFSSRVNLSGPSLTVPSSMDRTSRCNKVDTVRLYTSYRLNLLLLKKQRCVLQMIFIKLKKFFIRARKWPKMTPFSRIFFLKNLV